MNEQRSTNAQRTNWAWTGRKARGDAQRRDVLDFSVQSLERRVMLAPIVSSPTTLTFSVNGDVLTFGWNEAEAQNQFGSPAANITMATSGDLAGYILAVGPNIGGNPNFAAVELAGINRIVVNGTNFNDQIVVAETLTFVFELNGMGGDDVIAGGAGTDTLNGGAGMDTLLGRGGNDQLFGGAGNDLLIGGEGNDGLNGEANDDTLSGDNGNDNLSGGGGMDTLVGGTGNDTLSGGTEGDILIGGADDDTLHGDAGDDVLFGDNDPNSAVVSGSDMLFGGTENDLLFGGNLNDTLFGGGGNDTADGGAGNDMIHGDAGDDILLGAGGDDIISGDAGMDTLVGDDGNDTLSGGTEGDVLIGGAGDDVLRGDEGNDVLFGDNDPSSPTVSGMDDLFGGAGNDQLFGGNLDDNLFGGADADLLLGEDGNDLLDGEAGMDTLSGGMGNDHLSGGTEDDVIVGGEGNDVAQGGTGNDVLVGEAGNDQLNGDAGDDVLLGGAGSDFLAGNDGNDVYQFDVAVNPEVDTIAELANEGTDIVDMRPLAPATAQSTNHAGTSLAESQNRILNVAVAGQQLNIEFGLNIDPFVEWVEAPTFGVTFQPLRYVANVVDVGTQVTHFVVFDLGDGNVPQFPLNETDGRGTVDLTHEYETFGSFQQFLIVIDSFGNATVLTNTVAVRQIAIAPDLEFPQFFSLYIGGTVGDDQIILSQGIEDSVNVSYNGHLFRNLDFSGSIYVYGGKGNDRLTLPATLYIPALLSGGDGDDFIRGGAMSDTLLGGSGNDSMFGSSGNDYMEGNTGDDRIQGDDGNDILLGGDGDDDLIGSGGRDLLIGQAGSDELVGGAGIGVMIGGTTSHDGDRTALEAIQAELSQERGDGTQISAYVDNLMNGGGANGAVVLVRGVTVFDDLTSDTLNGAVGSHLIFEGIDDVLLGISSDDILG